MDPITQAMAQGSADEALTDAQFMEALASAGNGEVKVASEDASGMIRDRIRESQLLGNIIPAQKITYSDLTYIPGRELGVMVDNYEPTSPGARTVPFAGAPDTVFFRGQVFVTQFYRETTDEYAKLVDELAGYTQDLRQNVTDLGLKELDNHGDTTLFATCNSIVGSVGGVGSSGLEQNYQITGQINRRSYSAALDHLSTKDLLNGVWVINQETANGFIGFDHDQWGGSEAQEIWKEGMGAMTKTRFAGVDHLVTIKRTQVPKNVAYQFTIPGFLGKHYILEDVRMHVEKKDDQIRWYASRKAGATIANVKGVCRTAWV